MKTENSSFINFLEENLIKMQSDNKEEGIFISLENSDMHNSLFATKNTLQIIYNEDMKDFVKIEENKFNKFRKELLKITKFWHSHYFGNKTIQWSITIINKNSKKEYLGIGKCPSNWNKFINLLCVYDKLFQELQKEQSVKKDDFFSDL